MKNYYVTAVVTRPMAAADAKQIATSGRIYICRVKTIVQADSPAWAISAGSKDILNGLAGSGFHASDYGCMPVAMAAELGDAEIYDKYPSATTIRGALANSFDRFV